MDDVSGEILGDTATLLMEAGALDVATEAVFMKKQRPGVRLSVMCRALDRETMLALIFRHATTFGIRESVVTRHTLDRHFVEVDTVYGRIRVKVGSWRGEALSFAPEYEDCRRAARLHQVAVRTVMDAARAAL